MPDKISFIEYEPEKKHLKKVIVLHSNKPIWIVLNQTALEILKLFKQYVSIDEVTKIIAVKYNIDKAIANKDVLFVYNQLKEKSFFQKTNEFKRIPSLKSVFCNLTTKCNLKCLHCYNAIENNLDIPTEKVLNIIDELYNEGGNSITFSGGEPLLHPDIKKIIEYASLKLNVRILTNGTLIDQSFANFLRDKNVSIQISIDGSNEDIHDNIRGKGSFKLALNGINNLKNAGMTKNLNLCTTIMKQNLIDTNNIIMLADKLEIPMQRFLHLRRTGRAERKWSHISGMGISEYEKFIEYILGMQKKYKTNIILTCGMSGFILKLPQEFQEDEIWCPVGRMLIIDTCGSVYPCVLMMDNEFSLGNIFNEGLAKIIKSDKILEICNFFSNRRLTIKKCSKCTFRNFCQSGCMGQALDHNDSIHKTDNFCNLRKKLYKEAFDKILSI